MCFPEKETMKPKIQITHKQKKSKIHDTNENILLQNNLQIIKIVIIIRI